MTNKAQQDKQHSKNTRQSAGQESIRLTDDVHGDVLKKDDQKHRITKLSADLAVLKMANSKNNKNRKCIEPTKYPSKTVDSSLDKVSLCKKQTSDKPNDINSLFEKASMEVKRRVNVASERFDDECKVFTPKKS